VISRAERKGPHGGKRSGGPSFGRVPGTACTVGAVRRWQSRGHHRFPCKTECHGDEAELPALPHTRWRRRYTVVFPCKVYHIAGCLFRNTPWGTRERWTMKRDTRSDETRAVFYTKNHVGADTNRNENTISTETTWCFHFYLCTSMRGHFSTYQGGGPQACWRQVKGLQRWYGEKGTAGLYRFRLRLVLV